MMNSVRFKLVPDCNSLIKLILSEAGDVGFEQLSNMFLDVFNMRCLFVVARGNCKNRFVFNKIVSELRRGFSKLSL